MQVAATDRPACRRDAEGAPRECLRVPTKVHVEESRDGPGPSCPARAAGGLKAAEANDVVRTALQTILQALIETEATAVTGAGPA